jgi:hypothetical protein
MSNTLKLIAMKLNAEDRRILSEVSHELQKPMADVIRWAIRYYAVRGPWLLESDRLPLDILARNDGLQVGPDRKDILR